MWNAPDEGTIICASPVARVSCGRPRGRFTLALAYTVSMKFDNTELSTS